MELKEDVISQHGWAEFVCGWPNASLGDIEVESISSLAQWPPGGQRRAIVGPAQGWQPALHLTQIRHYMPINLEERLRTVEEAVAGLRETVAELSEALRERPLVLSTEIVDLGSENYSLCHPIPIVIEESEEEIVASFPETETFASGGTPSEAIGELKRQIVLLYEDLANSDPAEFGKLPAAWWRILQYYISKQ